MNIYPSGLGEVLGDTLVTTRPLQMSGFAWFVNSTIGVDAASPAGRDRQKPLATVTQAHTNAADGDIIVLESGHSETVTGPITITKRVIVAGGGSSAGIPSVNFTINAAASALFILNVDNVELRNLWIKAALQSNTGGVNGKISIAGANCRLTGLYIESSGNDQFSGGAVRLIGANTCRIANTTFISTATAVATRPTAGLLIASTAADLELYGVTFNDGTVGYSSAAFDGTAAAATRLRGESISMLNGADALLSFATTTGYMNVATSTGGGKVSW